MVHTRQKFLLLLALLTVCAASACSAPQLASSVKEVASPQNVAIAEASLAAAERLALIYTSLPSCTAVRVFARSASARAAALCADPGIKARIKAADNQAYMAVMAARQNPMLVDAAVAAIGVLTNLIPVPAQ